MLTAKLIVAALLVVTAHAEAEFLPAPTGPHATGRVSFQWQDGAREELETAAADDRRELMVHVFYPADPAAKGEPAVYVPDAEEMRGPWRPEQIERIQAMRGVSSEGAPLAPGSQRYPVAVFLAGGGMKVLTYHALLEDLASHGWIVAAIDAPYNPKAVRLPDGRVLGNLPPKERGWPQPKSREENERFYRERVLHMARDVPFVLDKLAELDQSDPRFAGRIDLASGVGVFGHSRGGQAAGAARLLDPRVRSGINLDGVAGDRVIQTADGSASPGDKPFLWIQNALPPPPSEQQLKWAGKTIDDYHAEIKRIQAAWDEQLQQISGGAIRVSIDRPDVEHIDFSDEPFWDGQMTAESRPGKEQTIAQTRAWLRAFLDGTIRGEWDGLQKLSDPDAAKQDQQSVQIYGKLWP